MSVTNGKTLVAPEQVGERVNGRHVRPAESTAQQLSVPVGAARPRPAVGEGYDDGNGFDEGLGEDLDEAPERAAVNPWVERARAAEEAMAYGDNRALIEFKDLSEVDADHALMQLERQKDREFQQWQINRSLNARKWQARFDGVRQWLNARAARRDESAADSDARWHVKANRTRKRMTSIDARIASQIRSATIWSNVLIALMVLGMAYTGFTVQRQFVPSGDTSDPRWWLALGLEAMCSVALMALMRFDARASLAGVKRGGWQAFGAWVVKVLLLVGSLLAAAGPAIVARHGQEIVANGWAPLLVAAVLLIHDRIARGDQAILTNLGRVAEGSDLDNLVVLTRIALERGMLQPSQDGTDAPSASQLTTFFKISKPLAIRLRDTFNAQAAQ